MSGIDYRVVIVTGASRGLGREIALKFGANRCRVVVNYREQEDAARATAEEVLIGVSISSFHVSAVGLGETSSCGIACFGAGVASVNNGLTFLGLESWVTFISSEFLFGFVPSKPTPLFFMTAALLFILCSPSMVKG